MTSYFKIFYRALIKPVLFVFAVTALLMWTVGSGFYLIAIFGTYFTEGKFVLVSQMDHFPQSSTDKEWYLFWAANAYWIVVLAGIVYFSLKKEYGKTLQRSEK